MKNILGQRIKLCREKFGWTQRDLAAKAGYTSHTSIGKIETGVADMPQSKIKQMAQLFGVSPAWLLGWDDKESQEKIIGKKDQVALVVTNQQRLLLIAYRQLTDNQKGMIRRMLGIGGVSLQADSESFSEQDNAC